MKEGGEGGVGGMIRLASKATAEQSSERCIRPCLFHKCSPQLSVWENFTPSYSFLQLPTGVNKHLQNWRPLVKRRVANEQNVQFPFLHPKRQTKTFCGSRGG